MGADALVFLTIITKSFKLQHPVGKTNDKDGQKDPGYEVCNPPVFQLSFSEDIKGNKQNGFK